MYVCRFQGDRVVCVHAIALVHAIARTSFRLSYIVIYTYGFDTNRDDHAGQFWTTIERFFPNCFHAIADNDAGQLTTTLERLLSNSFDANDQRGQGVTSTKSVRV